MEGVPQASADQVVSSLNHPWDIVVSREHNSIFWTESHGDRIVRANLDGSNVQTILTINDPESLAIDFTTERIYWGGIGLQRANLDGTGVATLAASGQNVTGVAVDTTSQRIYFSDHFGERIGRVSASGGAADFYINGLSAKPLALALDEAGGLIYWSDQSHNIWRANLADGTGRIRLYENIHYSRDMFYR